LGVEKTVLFPDLLTYDKIDWRRKKK